MNLPLSHILRLKKSIQKEKQKRNPVQSSAPGISEEKVQEIAEKILSARVQSMIDNLSRKLEATTHTIMENERALRAHIESVAAEGRNVSENMSKEINHLRTRLHEVELNESRRGRFEYRQPMQSTQSWHGDNQQRHAQEKGHDRRFDSIIVNRDAPGPPIPMPT